MYNLSVDVFKIVKIKNTTHNFDHETILTKNSLVKNYINDLNTTSNTY
jgi:hypothetical protein